MKEGRQEPAGREGVEAVPRGWEESRADGGEGHGVNAKPGWDLSLAGVRTWVANCDDKAE